ncbi:MAG: XrtN system VIT domain-containing protein [Marinoscillum sp.]
MKTFNRSKHLVIGLVLYFLSAAFYGIEITSLPRTEEMFSSAFYLHYSLALIYYGYLWITYRKRFFLLYSRELLPQHLLLLLLFNLSAFSLNRTLTVFYESTDWLTILLCIENLSILTFIFFRPTANSTRSALVFVFSVGLCFHIYQFMITMPVLGIGIIASPFLGISLLILVPIFFIIGLVKALMTYSWNPLNRTAFIIGFLVVFGSCGYTIYQWRKIDYRINDISLQIDAPNQNDDLPDWIRLSQNIEGTPWFETYLKRNLVYQPFTIFDDSFFGFNRLAFEDYKIHDPLVSIASIFDPSDHLNQNTCIKILNFLYDKRHESGDRFWSGSNLTTDQIVTNIELFPKSRISFTEHIITVKNNLPTATSQWRNQQEAFYTFQLPEGGIVTSLSLWIGGKEEKGMLTTKGKAKKAYDTIVGREMRDPSVVYWMEGNQIRVRVFPCTPLENRKFKIGVTAPLQVSEKLLSYVPTTFKGPSVDEGKMAVNIVDHGASYKIEGLTTNAIKGSLAYKGNYKDHWKLTLYKPAFSGESFTYKEKTYVVSEWTEQLIPRDVTTFYLDLSSNWTSKEIKSLISILEDHQLLTFTHQGFRKFTESNISQVHPEFSLFPFHHIKSTQTSLVITKGEHNTPNLEDLKASAFGDNLNIFFQTNDHPPLVLDIGESPTDYMRSLKEFHVIDYNKVSLEELANYVSAQRYPSSISSDDEISIPNSDLKITQTSTNQNFSSGSDHLMRLFSYQQIMRRIGKSYFNKNSMEYLEDQVIDLASTAHIVTPVSSLIVLESQKDYDRFGIEQNKDSLGNANINNSGEAPEPHEWALIGIGLIGMIYIYRKKLLEVCQQL